MVIINTKQKKGRPHIRIVKAEIRGKSLLTWFYPMTLYSAAPRALAGKCSEQNIFQWQQWSAEAIPWSAAGALWQEYVENPI